MKRKGRIKPINGVKNYLNSNVNVDENPHDNFFLYKEWLCREKGICVVLHKDFGKQEYLDEYIEHMHRIGWNQDPVLVEPIPQKELNKQIEDVIKTFNNTENILYRVAQLEGREGLAHRTIRDWVGFIRTVLFGEDYDPIKREFDNFLYGDGEEQILRWAAIYYLYMKKGD